MLVLRNYITKLHSKVWFSYIRKLVKKVQPARFEHLVEVIVVVYCNCHNIMFLATLMGDLVVNVTSKMYH